MRAGISHWNGLLGTLSALMLALGGLSTCSASEQEEAEAGARQLGDNVEESGRIMKDTWDKDRAEGEGAIEAAGDAYNAVLDEGRKKADRF